MTDTTEPTGSASTKLPTHVAYQVRDGRNGGKGFWTKTFVNSQQGDFTMTTIDILCGGYPCQPFSVAGKQLGEKDPRHLWPEMYRILREVRPRWVICENVLGHVELGLDAVLDDLEAAGYAATTFVVPACAVGAPHRRDRVWIVAHAAGLRLQRHLGPKNRQPAQELPDPEVRRCWPSPFTVGSFDAVPGWMDRVRALGNAVIPAIPERIGQAILAGDPTLIPSFTSHADSGIFGSNHQKEVS